MQSRREKNKIRKKRQSNFDFDLMKSAVGSAILKSIDYLYAGSETRTVERTNDIYIIHCMRMYVLMYVCMLQFRKMQTQSVHFLKLSQEFY